MAFAFIFVVFMCFIIFVVSIAMYLLNSFALMTMMKNKGEKLYGLAFVPYVNAYFLGKIGSDKGKNEISYLGIAYVAMMVITSVVSMLSWLLNYIIIEVYDIEEFTILIALMMMALSIAMVIIHYIVYSRIFVKYSENGTLFTILTIFLGGGILAPIFLFIIKDNCPCGSKLKYKDCCAIKQ